MRTLLRLHATAEQNRVTNHGALIKHAFHSAAPHGLFRKKARASRTGKTRAWNRRRRPQAELAPDGAKPDVRRGCVPTMGFGEELPEKP